MTRKRSNSLINYRLSNPQYTSVNFEHLKLFWGHFIIVKFLKRPLKIGPTLSFATLADHFEYFLLRGL